MLRRRRRRVMADALHIRATAVRQAGPHKPRIVFPQRSVQQRRARNFEAGSGTDFSHKGTKARRNFSRSPSDSMSKSKSKTGDCVESRTFVPWCLRESPSSDLFRSNVVRRGPKLIFSHKGTKAQSYSSISPLMVLVIPFFISSSPKFSR